jgi:cytochrome c peroxidase
MTYGNDGQYKQLGLTEKEIQQLTAFLNTLTDNSFVTDSRFSDPFTDKK